MSRNPEDVKYEEHRKYIDIQYVASGNELIGISPLSQQKDVLDQYNETKDVLFVTVLKEVYYKATPDKFFIFLPRRHSQTGTQRRNKYLGTPKLLSRWKVD